MNRSVLCRGNTFYRGENKMNYGQIKRRKILLIIFLFVASLVLPMAVSAGAPPNDCRAGYLLPQSYKPDINRSEDYSFNVTYSFESFEQPFREPPYFPNVTKNFAFMNISYDTTGDRYISEVWYFNDWNEFDMQRNVLFDYLNKHGTTSNVTLDLSDELAGTHDDYISGLRTREVDALKYESPETSGYFLIFSTNIFPGPNYYIAYYGTVGPGVLENHSGRLEIIIMTVFPYLMENHNYESNPKSPMPDTATPLPALVPALALGVAMLWNKLKR